MDKPYEIVGELKRVNRRRAVSAHDHSVSASAARGKKAKDRQKVIASGKCGYGREDFALQAGARAPHRQLHERRQELAESTGTAPTSDRYEPEDWAGFTGRVKDAAIFCGASMVGVTRVNPLWLYACDGDELLPEGMDTAVVVAIEMDYQRVQTSPAVTASAAVGMGYSKMAFTATCLARFLAELGWRAVPSGNDTALSIPLAVDAGLGEMGRSGMLITRPYGPRVRLCKVFTDALLVADEPICLGVRETCRDCIDCAVHCPGGAIPRGEPTAVGPSPANNPGVLKWHVHPDKCLAFWAANGTGCCNCIRSCPYNEPPA